MQTMLYDSRLMRRYARVEATQDDGDAVAEYVLQVGQYRLSFRPTARTKEDTERGTIPRVSYHVYVNDTHDFEVGDRIGDDSEEKFEIFSVIDNFTGQVLEVSEL